MSEQIGKSTNIFLVDIHGPPTQCNQWPQVTQTLLPLPHTQPPTPKPQLPYRGRSHETPRTHMLFYPLHFKTDWLKLQIYKPDELREKSNTSAICMYIMCNFKNFIDDFGLIMISIFGIHMETHVLTIQIILYHFWSNFYNIYFYYSDHIIFFGSDSYISFYTYVIFTTRVPCLGLPSFLISNPKYTVLLLTSFSVLIKFLKYI